MRGPNPIANRVNKAKRRTLDDDAQSRSRRSTPLEPFLSFSRGRSSSRRGQRGHWRRRARYPRTKRTLEEAGPSRRGQVTLEEARTSSRTLDSQKIYRNIMCMFTLPVLSWWFEKFRHARTQGNRTIHCDIWIDKWTEIEEWRMHREDTPVGPPSRWTMLSRLLPPI